MKAAEIHRKTIVDGAAKGFLHAAEQASQSVSPALMAEGLLRSAVIFGAQHLPPAQFLEILDHTAEDIRARSAPG